MDKNIILKTEYKENEEIKNLTTYKTEGHINGAFYPKTESEFKNIYLFLKENKLPFIIIGNGSNLLISPNTNIFAISTKKLKQTIMFKNNNMYISSSVTLSQAYLEAFKRGYSGFEALAGIPATIGGAIKTNASAFGNSIFDILEYIKIFSNGKTLKLKKENIQHAYHSTNINNCIILSAKFNLNKKSKYQIKKDFSQFMINRSLRQPKGLCCGSIFRNPPYNFAGKLIEACGLKGHNQNDAQISPVHANFIINKGNASYYDIKSLIELSQLQVKKKFGIDLECEVEIIE